ncbi:hypothetical protein A0H81_07525 [Grifola frondosa]|uniref:Uncharacterized protein n=1 Tax=Grifola frondosa TaxID=5627 RepID=A0A1C7M5S6_GRIFR|nr:hypothetical protein A0H81_07525 [Grifola frondosa]
MGLMAPRPRARRIATIHPKNTSSTYSEPGVMALRLIFSLLPIISALPRLCLIGVRECSRLLSGHRNLRQIKVAVSKASRTLVISDALAFNRRVTLHGSENGSADEVMVQLSDNTRLTKV